MEYYYFVIIVIIVLKILFWTFYFYVRAQRLRQTQTMQRFIIIGAQPVTRGRSHPYSDRSAIIDHAEPVSATGPPPYAEVVKDGNGPLPPSYDQAIAVPEASDYTATPANNAPAFQGSSHGAVDGASAMPAYGQASTSGASAGSSIMPGYSPSASQMNSDPRAYSQAFSGQVAPHSSASMGQNFSTPQQ